MQSVALALLAARRRARRRCVAASSTGAPAARPTPTTTITLVTHDSFAVSKSVLAAFTKQTGIKVKVLKAGDAGAALNQAILTKDHPVGDVFFGVDNTFLTRALDAGIFDAVHRDGPRPRARRVPARPDAPGHADRQRRRVRQLRQAVVRAARARGARRRSTTSPSPRTRGCSWSRTRRRRRPGSRSCSRRSRSTATDGWQRLLDEAARQRRAGRRRLGEAYDGDFTAGGSQRHVPARRVVRVEPAGRGVLREAAAEDGARSARCPTRASGRSSSRACCKGADARGRGAQARRLHALARRSRTTCRCRCSCSRCATARRCPTVFAKFAEVAPDPLTLPADRDRREPRRVDRAVDRHRAAVTARARVRTAVRWPSRARDRPARVPRRLLRVAGRRDPRARPRARTARSTSTRSRDVVTDAGLRHVAWFTVWQAALSTVLTLARRAAGRVRARRATSSAGAGSSARS